MSVARRLLVASRLVLVTTLAAAPAWSGVTLEMREVGGDVVLSGSGTLDTSAWTLFASGSALGGQVKPDGFFLTGPPLALVDVYASPVNFSGPTAIGPGTTTFVADSGSGKPFGMRLDVPRLGVIGGSLTGSSTWNGATLASLGVTPGSYVWSWGSGGTADSLTLHAIGGNCTDLDGDGYGDVGDADCPGGLAADCDDGDPLIHPGAADVCDAVDNNCQDGADEGGVCSAALAGGTQVALELEVVRGTPLPAIPFVFPIVLGGPDFSQVIADFQIDIDIENESIDVVVSNLGGGRGNVAVLASITGLQWTDADTHVIGASAVSDFDYVYASTPPPFPAPGVAGIVDNGHGIQIYLEELLLQSSEVHTATVSFAAGPVKHPAQTPALSAPAIGLLAGLTGALGWALVRRRAARSA